MSKTDTLFGIMGLTPSGLGIWTIAGGLFAWYIRGISDRRRARNEGVTIESNVSDAQFKRLVEEINR